MLQSGQDLSAGLNAAIRNPSISDREQSARHVHASGLTGSSRASLHRTICWLSEGLAGLSSPDLTAPAMGGQRCPVVALIPRDHCARGDAPVQAMVKRADPRRRYYQGWWSMGDGPCFKLVVGVAGLEATWTSTTYRDLHVVQHAAERTRSYQFNESGSRTLSLSITDRPDKLMAVSRVSGLEKNRRWARHPRSGTTQTVFPRVFWLPATNRLKSGQTLSSATVISSRPMAGI